jgi:putative ABC transport system permease protein
MNDLHFAFRQLRQSPGFTAVAVLTLALGIGVNTTIFSLVNGVVLRPLPFRDPERLVFIDENSPRQGFDRLGIAYPDYLDWRQQNTVFEDIGVYGHTAYTLTGRDQPERLLGVEVSASLFALLGVQPVVGRPFISGEDQPGAAPVALISHGLWQRRFGGDTNLLGQVLTLDGRSHTVVGIMPPRFAFPETAELWTPLMVDNPESQRSSHTYAGVARLKRGITIRQARTEMAEIARRIEAAHAQTHADVGVVLGPLRDDWVGEWSVRAWLLLGAVSFVLVIACANVANLLLARALSRRKEFAVRAALGATRWRTARQLLIESLLLSGAAALVGLGLSLWGVDAFLAVIPEQIPFWMQFTVDGRLLAFTLAVSLATGVLFGLAPAWGAAQTDLNETLKENARSATASRTRHRMRTALVVTEVALAVVLLSGAGLTIASFLRLLNVNPGFNPEPVVVFDLSLPPEKYPDANRQTTFYESLRESLSAVPGVKASGGISHLPLTGRSWGNYYTVEGQEAVKLAEVQVGNARVVTPGYFRTLEVPLLAGRDFTDADTASSPPVIIIDATLSRRFFTDRDPLGHRIKLGGPDSTAPWMTIVGVVGEVKHYGLNQEIRPGFYLPHAQHPRAFLTLVARTALADPATVAATLRRAVQGMDPDLPVFNLRTMQDLVSQSCWPQRLLSQLFTVFSVLGITLAAVGIYAVVARSVAQRTHEIGIRMALGARRSDVLKLAVRQGMGAVGLGMILGLAANFGLLWLLASQLYEVGALNLPTYAAAALLILGVALAACYLPARRAAKVDPIVALRYE